MKKLKNGAVYTAIEAGSDIAIQLIGRNNVIGSIIRVCRFSVGAERLCDTLETLFVIGFPIYAAVKDGYLKYISDCSIPLDLLKMNFRFPNNPQGEIVKSWTILFDSGQKIVSELSHDQQKYPLAYSVNIKSLERLISTGWNGRDLIS